MHITQQPPTACHPRVPWQEEGRTHHTPVPPACESMAQHDMAQLHLGRRQLETPLREDFFSKLLFTKYANPSQLNFILLFILQER